MNVKKASAMNRIQFFLTVMVLYALAGEESQAFYNPQTGRWLNRDVVEEFGGLNLFSFAANSPLSRFDPDGSIVINAWPTRAWDGDCGGFSRLYTILLSTTHPQPGYVVQRIEFSYRAKTCYGLDISQTFIYFESLPFAANNRFPDRRNNPFDSILDHWAYPDSPFTRGSLTMTGDAKFFYSSVTGYLGGINESASPADWIVGASHGGIPGMDGPPFSVSSGPWPSTETTPSFWTTPPIEVAPSRSVSKSWDCCPCGFPIAQ